MPNVVFHMGLSEGKLKPKINRKLKLGVRDLCTGRCNSKYLINSDKTGLDMTLLPLLNLRVFDIMDLQPLMVLV